MSAKNSQDAINPEDWKRVARKDWERIQRNLRDNDPEAAGFYFQQSLEKYLKGYLLQHGWELKKIHTLHTLLKDAVEYNPDLESFRELCQKISGYYVIDRYPLFAASGLTSEDVKRDLDEAKQLILTLFPEEPLNG